MPIVIDHDMYSYYDDYDMYSCCDYYDSDYDAYNDYDEIVDSNRYDPVDFTTYETLKCRKIDEFKGKTYRKVHFGTFYEKGEHPYANKIELCMESDENGIFVTAIDDVLQNVSKQRRREKLLNDKNTWDIKQTLEKLCVRKSVKTIRQYCKRINMTTYILPIIGYVRNDKFYVSEDINKTVTYVLYEKIDKGDKAIDFGGFRVRKRHIDRNCDKYGNYKGARCHRTKTLMTDGC
jgi:hypothetical protein